MSSGNSNELIEVLNKHYASYLELLTGSDEQYMLAVPPNAILKDKDCIIDENMINEHILELSFDGKELVSMSSKTYQLQGEKRLTCSQKPGFEALVLSRDICYANNHSGSNFKRMVLSNSLDQRYYRDNIDLSELNEAKNSSDALDDEENMQVQQQMRDPFEFIQFFKESVYHDVEETYIEVLEDIKLLKENHMLIKGSELVMSKFFKKISDKLMLGLDKSNAVQEQFGSMSDQRRRQTLENFVETLIYERIGSYMLKTLINLYRDDENKFASQCNQLFQLYLDDVDQFNQLFGSDLTKDIQPMKSVLIFKVFFRCQLPYEMFYTLNETIEMASQELSKYYNKPKSSFDAQTILPYIVLIISKTYSIILQEMRDSQTPMTSQEKKRHGLKARLQLMEHFTVHVFGMNKIDYLFVTFKEAEKAIDDQANQNQTN